MPDALALEGIRARHVRERLSPWHDRWVEDLESCHHALLSLMTTVTASDEVRLAPPGMKHEKEPAPPPAATTRMSSGDCTVGRLAASSSRFTAPGIPAGRFKWATRLVEFSTMNLRLTA